MCLADAGRHGWQSSPAPACPGHDRPRRNAAVDGSRTRIDRSGTPYSLIPTLRSVRMSKGPTDTGGRRLGAATLTQQTIASGADLDREDVVLAKGGDTTAFERIYRRHAARIHTLCARMLTPEEADDLTQDVFIRAWQKLALFRGDSAFGTWLYRLAVNLILARRQTFASRRSRFDGGDPDSMVVAGRRDRPDLRVDFDAAIRTLPRGAREVFVMHDVEGYTHEEIAGLLNVTAGTSKSQLHRARMSLRQYLG